MVDFWKNNENFHQNFTINLDFDMALEDTIVYLEGYGKLLYGPQ